MTIEYVNSYDINDPSELIEIFNEGKGIIINGRIYTSIESILEVYYLNERYKYEMSNYGGDFDNEVKTPEFERISILAYNQHFKNSDYEAVVENGFESMMGL